MIGRPCSNCNSHGCEGNKLKINFKMKNTCRSQQFPIIRKSLHRIRKIARGNHNHHNPHRSSSKKHDYDSKIKEIMKKMDR